MPADRPNVLWIVLEDTSPRLGCYGDDLARTPNVDEFAEAGRVYERAFSSSPVCAPSRAAMNTGCYQTSIGAHHMRTSNGQPGDRAGKQALPGPYEAVPPHYVTLLSERLRRAGYFTTMAGSTDFQFATPITAWDECDPAYDPFYDDLPEWTVEDAHWRGRPDDRPFFSVFNPGATHESGMWPSEGDDLETDPGAVDVPPYLPDVPATRRAIARQYDNLARADEAVGELLAQLEADGLTDETLVVVTSDHGEGLPRNKRWPYDSGTHVPMVVRWPGEVEAGDRSDRLVSHVDLAPTMLRAAGLDVPAWMEGRPFLGPDTGDPREYVFAARDRHDELYDTVRAVRDDRFRYVRHYRPGAPYVEWNAYRNGHPAMAAILERQADPDFDPAVDADADGFPYGTRPAEELYDLHADPHEVENLAGDPEYADVLDRLRDALDDWQARTGDRGLEPEVETIERAWPGGEQPETAPPMFVPNAPGNRAVDDAPDGATLEGPATLALHSGTQGAGLVYRIEGGDENAAATAGATETGDGRWRLYDGPIRLPAGETTVTARAVRYGYAESEERTATFVVE